MFFTTSKSAWRDKNCGTKFMIFKETNVFDFFYNFYKLENCLMSKYNRKGKNCHFYAKNNIGNS